jgi:arginyl-tRNA synthetase
MILKNYQNILNPLGIVAKQVFGDISPEEVMSSVSFCDTQFGDISTNLAMKKASQTGQAPRELAQKLASALEEGGEYATCEVAGAGFVNIRLKDRDYANLLSNLDANFYKSQSGKGKRVNVEFISANPTGPLVLVNAWGGYYGDILASFFTSQGYEVTREYYLNDGGRQIFQLGRALQQAVGVKFDDETAAELYRGEYIDELAGDLVREYGSDAELKTADAGEIGDKAQAIILDNYIKPTLERMGIHHDVIYKETSLDNRTTLTRLGKVSAILKKDDAIWLNGERAGLEKDEVLVRSTDQEDTYFLKDISYQLGKLEERKYDLAITIVGPDHHGQEKRLIAALRLLGHENFVPLWTQTVRLTKDGQEFKMSKRRGNYILLDDFFDSVSAQTARFFFAMRDTRSHFDIDLDLITAQNKHNPMFYVMYSYARASSVLSKLAEDSDKQANYRLDDVQKAIIKSFVELANLVQQSTTNYQVHPVLHQMIEIARGFHEWYENNPVISEKDLVLRASRVEFVKRYRDALGGALKLIGIEPQANM